MSNYNGIISPSNLWESTEKNLFEKSFKGILKYFKNEEQEALKKAEKVEVGANVTIDRECKLVIKIRYIPRHEKFYLLGAQRIFSFKCDCTNKTSITCEKAVLLMTDHRSESCVVEPLAPMFFVSNGISNSSKKTNDIRGYYEMRAYITDFDKNVIPSYPSEYNLSELELGMLYFKNDKNKSGDLQKKEALIVIRSPSDGSNKKSLEMWVKEASGFLDRLLDVFSFAQGGKIIPLIREVATENGGKTKVLVSDVSLHKMFMPVLRRQVDTSQLVNYLILSKNNQDDWEVVRRTIKFLITPQINEVGLLSKAVAIENMIKHFLVINKKNKRKKPNIKGLRHAICEFIMTDKGKKLFRDVPEDVLAFLGEARNNLAHGCDLDCTPIQLVELTAEAHDLGVRLVLLYLGFEGPYCRYGMNARSFGIVKLKDGQVTEIKQKRITEEEVGRKEMFLIIRFLFNCRDWVAYANRFMRDQDKSGWDF